MASYTTRIPVYGRDSHAVLQRVTTACVATVAAPVNSSVCGLLHLGHYT